jgi:hypothetical protein
MKKLIMIASLVLTVCATAYFIAGSVNAKSTSAQACSDSNGSQLCE